MGLILGLDRAMSKSNGGRLGIEAKFELIDTADFKALVTYTFGRD
jgi:hypothetical protein